MKTVYKLSASFLFVTTLLGCNTEQFENHQQSPYSELNAIDAYELLKPDVQNVVKMSTHISGKSVMLAQVTSLDNDCPEATVNGHRAFVSGVPAGQLCRYTYQVSDEKNQTKAANLTLFSTSLSEDAMIAPLSHAMTVGDPKHIFDLQALHGDEWPAGYQLDGSSLAIIGDGAGLGIPEHSSDNLISYTPSVVSGWNEITYVLADSSDPLAKMVGSIYITTSERENVAPEIQPKHYVYNDHSNTPILQNTQSAIDLTGLDNFSVQDSDAWFIESVLSYTADVDVNSTSNTTVDFIASKLGKHDLAYVVSDGIGGYSHGLMTIDVKPREQTRTWNDISDIYQGIEYTFFAPLLYSEVVSNFKVAPIWDANIQNTLAGFDGNLADAFCSTKGRLPTVTEVKLLRERGSNGILSDFSNWPRTDLYIVTQDNGSGFVTFDMKTEAVSPLSGDKEYIVSCVSTSMFSIDVVNYQVVADGQSQVLAHVKHSNDAVLSTTFLSDTINESADGVTIDISNGILSITGTKSGYFQVEVIEDAGGEQTTLQTPRLQFVAGAATSVTVNTNPDDIDEDGLSYLMADGVDQLAVIAQASDANTNIVADAVMFYSENANSVGSMVSADSNIKMTDEQGQATFILTGDVDESFADGTYSKVYAYDLTVAGQESTPFSFVLKHANFYDTVQLNTQPMDGNVIPATIQVLSRAGVPRAATIEVTGGIRGSIIHPGLFGEFENDILQRINVPAEGAEVWLTSATDNTPGGFTFELTGSPNSATAAVPASPRVMATLPLSSSSVASEASAESVRLLLDTADSLEVFRGATAAPQQVYLPQLRADEKGKTIFMINAGQNTFTVYPNPSDLSISYGMLKANFNGKNCQTRTYYWDGEKWMVLAPSLVPLPTIYWPNCANSDIYQ